MWMTHPSIPGAKVPVASSTFALVWQPVGWVETTEPTGPAGAADDSYLVTRGELQAALAGAGGGGSSNSTVAGYVTADGPTKTALAGAFGSKAAVDANTTAVAALPATYVQRRGQVIASGDTTGATDSAAIAAALSAYGRAILTGATYTIDASIVLSSGTTLLLDDATLRLADATNQPIIRNATIGKRTAVNADHDIAVICRGRSRIDGNPLGQTGFTGGQYWLNQGLVFCGVTNLHLDGGWAPLAAKKGAIHILGCARVTGGRWHFDQELYNNQDGLDIGPDCDTVVLSGFTGATHDDFFSFYAKATAAMIPPDSGYAGASTGGGGNITNVLITDVNGKGVAENLIRLQAADGWSMDRVHFADVISGNSNTLCRLGPTSYSTTPPTAGQFRNVSIDGVVHPGSGFVIESPCRGITLRNAQFTGPGGTLISAGDFATDCRVITVENVTTTEQSSGTFTALSSTSAAVLDDVQLRNIHLGRGRILANAGKITNLRARAISLRTAAAVLVSSSQAETGFLEDVSVDIYASGVTARLGGMQTKLRLNRFPQLTTDDITPAPTLGSRVLAAAGKDVTGGSYTGGAEYLADGVGWNRGIALAATPPTGDTTKPTAPTNLMATPGDGSVALTWTASTDNVAVTGYRVFRDNVAIATPTATSYTDTGRTNGTAYAYKVTALDAAGNESDPSATVSATPAGTTPPPGGGSAFLTEQMTGTDNTALTAHTSDSGHAWAKHSSSTVSGGNLALLGGRVISTVTNAVLALSSAVPASANYKVEADWYFPAAPTSQNLGVSVRADATANTQYTLRYVQSVGGWRLDKIVAGTTTTLGTYALAVSAGQTVHGVLSANGTSIQATINGVVQTAVTDSAITAVGQVGVFGNNGSTSTTGVHLDNLVATAL